MGWDVAEWVIGTCRGAMIAEKRTLHERTREVTQGRGDEPCGFEIACFAFIWLGASYFDLLFQIILTSRQTTESIISILVRTTLHQMIKNAVVFLESFGHIFSLFSKGRSGQKTSDLPKRVTNNTDNSKTLLE